MLLLGISFVAGLLTVLAPCILPLLPVIVGGSIRDTGAGVNWKRAFTITLSLGVSVILFTLLLKASTLLIDIPEQFWKWLSGGIIILFGVLTVFPEIWESFRYAGTLNRHSNALLGKHALKQNVWGDIVVGAALGPVFSTCSPTYFIVLATVLPVSPLLGMTYLLTYVLGLCLALLAIAFVGQKIMSRLGVAADPRGLFKRGLGVLFLLVGIAVLTGFDKKIDAFLVSNVVFDITKVEQYLLQRSMVEEDEDRDSEGEPVSGADVGTPAGTLTEDKVEMGMQLSAKAMKSRFPIAKEISTPDGFINTDGKEITLESLRGKVVLLDIWTYSCINCQRTIPYLNAWHDKYAEDGLVIIGLHTPEFAFEKKVSNVERAVEEFKIKYPVILDNDFSTWIAYGNNFWPRKYLIDIDGHIVYDHIGEGAYDETEREIQRALSERVGRLNIEASIEKDVVSPVGVVSVDATKERTPEIYFGAWRNSALINGKTQTVGVQQLESVSNPVSHGLYLTGPWNIQQEYAETAGATSIRIKYSAKNVYMVLSADTPQEVVITRDGQVLTEDRGKDVSSSGTMTVGLELLYHLVGDNEHGEHVLEIVIPKAGVKAFTFTFG